MILYLAEPPVYSKTTSGKAKNSLWWIITTIMKWSEVAQSCLTLCDLMDCSLPGSSVHRIFQAKVLEWVAISFSRGFSQPRDWTQVFHAAGTQTLYHWGWPWPCGSCGGWRSALGARVPGLGPDGPPEAALLGGTGGGGGGIMTTVMGL